MRMHNCKPFPIKDIKIVSIKIFKNKKHITFSPAEGARSPSPTKLGMVIKKVCNIVAPPKGLHFWHIMSAPVSAEYLGETYP